MSFPPMQPATSLPRWTVGADGHETQPPARYTEASLVKTLEQKEIGRPSTYASIISTIIDRGYVYERGRALIPSWLAFSVTKLLETKFPKYVDYEFTADMENRPRPDCWWPETGRRWLTRFYFGSGEGPVRGRGACPQQQVAQLGEIDAREINTHRYRRWPACARRSIWPVFGGYEPSGCGGQPKRASLPDTLARMS